MSRIMGHSGALIGNTPMLELDGFLPKGSARILLKLERFNPAGSVKDRVGAALIQDAEARGKLAKGGAVVEPTSGNTGFGLAYAGIPKGYRVILTMPETMSLERRSLLSAFGAELVLTAGGKGMPGAIEKARQLVGEIPGAYMPGQFENPANPLAHEKTTGPEIWRDADGKVDCFVAGVGTGGTITGVGRFLKAQNPAVYVAAVEPARSPVLSGGKAGPHGIQGIGAGFVPGNLDRGLLDEVLPVKDEDAGEMARSLMQKTGIMCGISSGAALWAGLQIAARPAFAGKTVVALLPDNGERYLSTGLFGPTA